MASVNINLTDELQQFVVTQTHAGQFNSPSEYIESLVTQAKHNRDSLETLLEEGLDSGEPIVLDDLEWSKIRAEIGSC